LSTDQRPPAPDALTALAEGDVELLGRMPWSSNQTYLAHICHDGHEFQAVYKPHRGERPLWDFPEGLFLREVAAYELSVALGWDLVPETVLRDDAPLGRGSLQRFVAADFEQHYFTLLEDARHHAQLRRVAVFDLLANNADRKSGHCLLTEDDHIWGIDHGLCFHAEPKLRTVIWDFGGERVDEALKADVARFVLAGVPEALTRLLNDEECERLLARGAAVSRLRSFPDPGNGRPYPWPLV
jgi:uncharacterized repeat protein (TIGR03843 family)